MESKSFVMEAVLGDATVLGGLANSLY